MNETDRRNMNDAELQELLDRYGSDTAKWPTPEASSAARLLAESGPARAQFDAARTLDGWLDGLRQHRAPAGLAATIMARIERRDPADRLLAWLTGRLWRPILVAALPVVAGFAIGFGLPQEADTDNTDLAGQIGALAFTDIYQELDDAEQP